MPIAKKPLKYDPAFTALKAGQRVEVTASYLLGSHPGRVVAKHPGRLEVQVKTPIMPKALWFPWKDVKVLPRERFDHIHPMLAQSVDDMKKPELQADALFASRGWLAEVKFDGERTILAYNIQDFKDAGKSIRFRATTRVVSVLGELGDNTAKLPHLSGLVPAEWGPTVFDGELLWDGGKETAYENFGGLREIMGCTAEEAVMRQMQRGFVRVVLYDCLWLDGEDLRGMTFAYRRRRLLEEVEKLLLKTPGLKVSVSEAWVEEDEKRALLSRVLSEGGEGIMLKNVMAPYTDSTLKDQRSFDILKVKPMREADVIVLGFAQGEGEYNQDKLGAIHFGELVPRSVLARYPMLAKEEVKLFSEAPRNKLGVAAPFWLGRGCRDLLVTAAADNGEFALIKMGTASGFTPQHEELWRSNPERYLGRAMAVKYQVRHLAEPDKMTGKMRHPFHLRIRDLDEKDPTECVFNPEA